MWAAEIPYVYIVGEIRAEGDSENITWKKLKRVGVASDGCIHLYATGDFKLTTYNYAVDSQNVDWSNFYGTNNANVVYFSNTGWKTSDYGREGQVNNYGDNINIGTKYIKLKPRSDNKFDLTFSDSSTLPSSHNMNIAIVGEAVGKGWQYSEGDLLWNGSSYKNVVIPAGNNGKYFKFVHENKYVFSPYGNSDEDLTTKDYSIGPSHTGKAYKVTTDNAITLKNISYDGFKLSFTVVEGAAPLTDTYKLNIGGTEVTMSTSDDGATYTASSTLSAGKTISLVNSTSGTTFYPSESATYKGGEATYIMTGAEGNTITTDNVNNASFSDNYTFTYTVDSNKLVVNGAPATYTYDKYYVKYSSDGWKSHEMDRQSDGTYTYKMTNPSSGCELAMQKNGTDSANDFWTNSEDNTYTGGTKSFTMEGTSSKNIVFGNGLSGDYTLTYNPSAKTLTISGGSTPTPSVSYRLKYTEDNWKNSKYSKPLTDNGNDTYGYTIANPVEGLQFMVQRSTDNGQSYFDFCWPAADDKDYKGGDKTFTMSGAFGNNVTFGAGLKGDYTLTFTPNTTDPKQSTLKIKGTAVAAFDEVYLRGSNPLSWSENNKDYKFSTTDGKIYTLTGVNLDKNVEMKAYNSTKDTWYGYDNSDVAGPTSNSNNNIKLNEKIDDATIILDLSGDKPKITIPKPVYLRGDFTTTAWTDDTAYKFSTTDGKIYTLTGVNIDNGKKMKVYYDGNPYGYDANKVSTPLKDDGTNDHNMQLYADLIDATLTFDITNPTNWKLTVDNNKDAYLRGDFTDPAWKKDVAYKFSTTDNVTYVLEHVNIANGKLLKVYYGGTYYGHDAGKVTGPVDLENETNYNMKLTEELKDATITFTMPTPYSDDWTVSIVNGGAVEHKAYYFAGDMNRWYSKKFDGDETASGIDPDIFAAEKDKWKFEYVGKVTGQTEKGWYKYVFKKEKVGMSTLVGQFQIIDDSGWAGSQYSNNPKVENYSDASGFARYNCRPITRKMINESTVLTKETSEGVPGIIHQAGSNFHLDCNGVNDAVIYFLPGENPKMFITGHPTDYFIFYSASDKDGGDNAVSIKIVNGKPNTTNYYLPGVEGLKNYTTEDAQTTAPHMNIEAVTPTLIDFSDANFVNDDNYNKVFGNSGYVGDLTKEEFQNKIINDSQLPNGISLTGRGKVYVAKVPNGFEYAAGRKFAVTFEKAFSQSEKETSSSIVANHLYFFNDNLHVLLNVDEYEAGAEKENAYVELYYRVYGYDSQYNTIVVKSDGTTETLYAKNVVIGLTEEGNDTQKNAGWVKYNNYKVPSLTSYTGSDKWHYVTDADNQYLGIDPKYGNFFVQFKIVTGPKPAQGANGPAKVVDKEYTLYLPEKTLALNQEGFYNFNGQDIYQKFEGGYTTTGVEDVFEDQIVEEGVDAEPIFFNLQGQRVVNPEKGMYIVVKGNKTYKVMIK